MDRRTALLALAILGLALGAMPRSGGVGPTYVEGNVFGTWTPEASPFVLLGNATVPAGQTLTVLAGVEVRADRGTSLAVLGTLDVEGTTAAPVSFTANATVADAGFWQGIRAANGASVTLTHASVDHAEGAVTAVGATVTLSNANLAGNLYGVKASAATVEAVDSNLAENTQAAVYAREGSTVHVSSALVAGNHLGLDLGSSTALVENTTFVAPTVADAMLDLGSVLTLRASPHEAVLRFVDEASRAYVEGVVTVQVRDAYGSPVAGASVRVRDNGNGTTDILAATGAEGRTPGLVVTAAAMNRTGAVDYNPFTITAEAGGVQDSVGVIVVGATEVVVPLAADLTRPAPRMAASSLAVDEGKPLLLDASPSTDNDPTFPGTGAFTWSFPSAGMTLSGIHTTATFATPGTVAGTLTVADRAGNAASLAFVVTVRDTKPPTITGLSTPERAIVGETVGFEVRATDNDPAFGGGTVVWRFSHEGATFRRFGSRAEVAFDAAGTWTVNVTVTDAAGNAASEERVVAVEAPASPWPWVGGGLALLAAALGLATERGKVGLLTLLIPLYTRIRDDAVLDQFTRGQIYGYIRVHPGDTYTDIKRNLDLNNGTLTYHLDVLERGGLVRSVVRGTRKMLYPTEVRPPEDGGGLHEVQARLLRALHEAPGIAVTDLAASLGLSRQLALYHLRLLARQNLVRFERRGVRLCAVATGGPGR